MDVHSAAMMDKEGVNIVDLPSDWSQLANGLSALSRWTSPVILVAAAAHLILFALLWIWYRRDVSAIVSSLDEFTRGLRHRSIQRSVRSVSQIDAFVQDIQDVLNDGTRREEREECWRRLHILDERRRYLDSAAFETTSNVARTMIEAYPLAGVLGTILAIGAALQASPTNDATSAMAQIVARFGEAIWSTFFGLCAAILLMFVQSLVETRFGRLAEARAHVRDVVAKAKRELGLAVRSAAESSR